jgi:rhomboid family GlyGly-CTERM serine protease
MNPLTIKNKTDQQTPWFTLTVATLITASYSLFGAANQTLVFNRDNIAAGELYQLLTGHFIHSDPTHLFWNLMGLLIIGSLLEIHHHLSILSHCAVFLLSAATIDLHIWLGEPALIQYCGLSGFLNTELALLLALSWQQTRHGVFPLITLAVMLKIGIETLSEQALFTQTTWTVVPWVHAVGLLTGFLFFLTFLWENNPRAVSPSNS